VLNLKAIMDGMEQDGDDDDHGTVKAQMKELEDKYQTNEKDLRKQVDKLKEENVKLKNDLEKNMSKI